MSTAMFRRGSCALGLLAAACGPSAAQTAPTLWSGKLAYDFRLNRPVALASYTVLSAHSPYILPQLSFGAIAFAGTVLGGNDSPLTGGIGGQIAFAGRYATFDAFIGQAVYAGAKSHIIGGLGIVFPLKG